MTPLDKAIETAGGITALARALGIKHQNVQMWRRFGRIPVAHIIAVEKVTGIPREELRPDLAKIFGRRA